MSEQLPDLFNLAANIARRDAARLLQLNPDELAERRRQDHANWIAALQGMPEAGNTPDILNGDKERR